MSYEFTEEKLHFLRGFLIYDPILGTFTRRDGKNRNRLLSDPAATAKTYKQINVQGVIYYAHILAYWFMTGGAVPDGLEIDHIDRNKQNFKWDNLRLVTSGRNKNNVYLRCHNQSGITGVRWKARERIWSAQINVDGVRYPLGRFESFDDAVRARLSGEQKYLGEIQSTQAIYGLPDPNIASPVWDRPPTGHPGVYEVIPGRFSVSYKKKRLGTFSSFGEAVQARKLAATK